MDFPFLMFCINNAQRWTCDFDRQFPFPSHLLIFSSNFINDDIHLAAILLCSLPEHASKRLDVIRQHYNSELWIEVLNSFDNSNVYIFCFVFSENCACIISCHMSFFKV